MNEYEEKREMNKYTSDASGKMDTYSMDIKCIFNHWEMYRLWTDGRPESRMYRKRMCVCGRRTGREQEWVFLGEIQNVWVTSVCFKEALLPRQTHE